MAAKSLNEPIKNEARQKEYAVARAVSLQKTTRRPRGRAMNDAIALNVFAALSHSARLSAFRRLAEVAPNGISAGVLARELNYNLTTLSTHLNILARAGLISGVREGRLIIYRAEFTIPAKFVSHFLTECCHGRASGGLKQADEDEEGKDDWRGLQSPL